MPRKKSAETAKRSPNAREQVVLREAERRFADRAPRPEVVWNDGRLDARHSDADRNVKAVADVLGTASNEFLSTQLGAIDNFSRQRGEASGQSAIGLNSSLALIAAIRPENELEAALAVELAGIHALACEMLSRTRHTERMDQVALYGGLAVKLTRTFTAQVEALAKLRGGGKQVVEVKHVYVNGNAVVGDVHHAGLGGGGCGEISEQPYAPSVEHTPGAAIPEVWGEDAGRDALPVAGSRGAEAVPDAWRE